MVSPTVAFNRGFFCVPTPTRQIRHRHPRLSSRQTGVRSDPTPSFGCILHWPGATDRRVFVLSACNELQRRSWTLFVVMPMCTCWSVLGAVRMSVRLVLITRPLPLTGGHRKSSRAWPHIYRDLRTGLALSCGIISDPESRGPKKKAVPSLSVTTSNPKGRSI